MSTITSISSTWPAVTLTPTPASSSPSSSSLWPHHYVLAPITLLHLPHLFPPCLRTPPSAPSPSAFPATWTFPQAVNQGHSAFLACRGVLPTNSVLLVCATFQLVLLHDLQTDRQKQHKDGTAWLAVLVTQSLSWQILSTSFLFTLFCSKGLYCHI